MRALHPRSLVCLVALVYSTHSVSAHRDTVIELRGTQLVGLPGAYAPAELDLKAFRLRIKKHETQFSPLLKSFFDLPYDLEVWSSWYHEPDIFPPYLTLAVHPKRRDYSYEIVFALDTLRVLEISVVLQESASTTQRLPVALSDSQKADIVKSIRKPR